MYRMAQEVTKIKTIRFECAIMSRGAIFNAKFRYNSCATVSRHVVKTFVRFHCHTSAQCFILYLNIDNFVVQIDNTKNMT